MPLNKKFERLVHKFGCKVTPVSAFINGTICRRPDIMAVTRHGQFVMTIPRKMYALKNRDYRDLINIVQPDYYECENKLYFKKFKG